MTIPKIRTSPKKLVKKLFPVVFYSLLICFLFLYIRSIDWDQIRQIHIQWQYVFIASLFGLFSRYWGIYIWINILKGLGASKLEKKTELVQVYTKSWMGRYIPGTAPWILGKIYFASKHGVSKSKLAVSSLLEGAMQITTVLAFGCTMLLFDRRFQALDLKLRLVLFALLIGCLLTMAPPVFNFILRHGHKLIKQKNLEEEHLVTSAIVKKAATLYMFAAFIGGFSLYFIAKAVYPSISYHDLLFVIGTGSIASAVSMLAVFAPSGLGVREGIQLTMFTLIMPREFALVITIITRLWSVAMDFVFYGSSRLLSLRRGK